MRPILRPALHCLPVLLGLAACGAVPGTSTYSCGLPEGVTCTSARNVYQLTNSGLPVTAMPGEPTALEAAAAASTGTATPAAAAATSPAATAARPGSSPSDSGWQAIALRPEDAGAARVLPLRTPAKVLRVWIAPWEDDAGRLHVPGYTYAEIEPRRWSIGGSETSAAARLQPLPAPSHPLPATPAPAPATIPAQLETQEVSTGPTPRRQLRPPPAARRQAPADGATQGVTYQAPP